MIFAKIIVYFLFFLSFKVNSTIFSDHIGCDFKKGYLVNKSNTNKITFTSLKDNILYNPARFLLFNNAFNLKDTHLEINDLIHHPLQKKMPIKVKYITVNKIIPRGTKIYASDLKVVLGCSNNLPYNTYYNKKEIINRISLRDIYPLQPITPFMIQPFWLIKVNQPVVLIIKGIYFKIISQGKSLKNAIINDIISVKTDAGTILTGIVNERGEVIVNL